MDHDQFGLVEDARNPRVIAKTAADRATVFKDTRGVFGEDSLPRRKNSATEYPPLPSVGMTRNYQINAFILIKIL